MSTTTVESLEADVLVDVVLDSSTEPLVTSVKQISQGTLVLEAPVDRSGRLVLPPRGMGGLLVWRDLDLVQAPLSVLGTSRPPGPQWHVRLTGRPSPCQRRSFVRADVDLPGVLRSRTAGHDVRVEDVSEGGLRCSSRTSDGLALEDRLQVDVELAGTPWSLPVDLVRLRTAPSGVVDLGLRFHDLALPDADRIRAFVFAEQRRRRALGAL